MSELQSPLPKSESEEELKLTPIDPKEEAEYNENMKETRSLRQNLLHKNDESTEAGEK